MHVQARQAAYQAMPSPMPNSRGLHPPTPTAAPAPVLQPSDQAAIMSHQLQQVYQGVQDQVAMLSAHMGASGTHNWGEGDSSAVIGAPSSIRVRFLLTSAPRGASQCTGLHEGLS